MTFFLVGLNHRTTPVELREQFFLSDDGVRLALETLSDADRLSEAIILSTCNRLEIYAEAEDTQAGCDVLVSFLARLQNTPADQLGAHLYLLEGFDAVEHLMRVAAGLDSLVLGESQILGQVTHALALAQQASTAGATLSHLFIRAIHAGKRARAETDISRNTVSISHAAAQLAEKHSGDLSDARALVVGAGEMAELAVRALQMRGAQSIRVISRTFANAQALAERLHLTPLVWESLADALAQSDVVITATSAPHAVIHHADVAQALAARGERALLFVDIAVPRDVDESVRRLPGVTLYDIDDLRLVVDTHRAQREMAVTDVERIIGEEIDEFLLWVNGRLVLPVLVDLRRKAEAVADAEVEHALRRLNGLDDHERAIVEQMAHRIVNKLLHAPTIALKMRAGDDDAIDYTQTVRELFALDTPHAAAVRVEEFSNGG